jgi:hypothetical protein
LERLSNGTFRKTGGFDEKFTAKSGEDPQKEGNEMKFEKVMSYEEGNPEKWPLDEKQWNAGM